MKKLLALGICYCWFLCSYSQVQIPVHIAASLKGDRSFKSYSGKMTQHLDSLLRVTKDSATLKKINSRYKKLARQLQYLEGHQDENGEIVNVSERNMKALEQFQQLPMAQTESPHLGLWSLIGPQHVTESYGRKGIGRVDRIAFHPTNANIIYAGTPAGGLFKTTTGGTIWSNVNSYIPSLGISGIVVSHANPSTLYVLTGDGDSNTGGFVDGFDYIRPSLGIFKSTDEGDTWIKTGLNIPGFYVGYKLIQSPSDANVLLAATSKGLYRTDNGGTSWDMVSSDSSRYFDIEYKPGSSVAMYATTANRFFISATAGQSFADVTSRIPDDISGCGRIAIAVTPNNANIVYLLAGRNTNGFPHFRIFRSTNSGGLFLLRSDINNVDGGTVEYMLNIAASPTNYNHIVTGNMYTRFSEDGGTTFVRSGSSEDANQNYVHADIHDLIYHPLDDRLFIGSDGGVFGTDDHGVTIFNRFLGMSNTQFYHLGVADNDENFVIGGAQDNGVLVKTDNTSFFKNYKAGDGFDIAMPHDFGTFVLTTINTETVFFSKSLPSTYWFLNVQNRVWFKSAATSWFDSTKFVGGTQILRWSNFGESNTPISTFDANGRWALTTSPSNGNRLYCAGGPEWNDYGDQSGKTLSRSDDKGATWTALHNSASFPSVFSKITSVAVHPANSNKVYVTFGGYQAAVKVYYSSNAGVNWTNLSGGLPDLPVNTVAVNDNGDIYIGTDIGVFYRQEGGTSWMPFFNGLPKVPVTDLQITNSYIYASTFGRGIWGSSTHGNCPLTINLTGDISGRTVYEAKDITASARLINGAGTEIYLKSENQTTLTPGFAANAGTGAEFRSYISPCGTGGLPLNVSAIENKNTAAMKLDSGKIEFELTFPALVTLYAADSSGNLLATINKPIRLNEGKQSLSLLDKLQSGKLVLVADGAIIGMQDLPKIPTAEEKKTAGNDDEAP